MGLRKRSSFISFLKRAQVYISEYKLCRLPSEADGSKDPPGAEAVGDVGLILGGKRSLEEAWQSTPVFLAEEFHGQRSAGQQSIGSQRVTHNSGSLACTVHEFNGQVAGPYDDEVSLLISNMTARR